MQIGLKVETSYLAVGEGKESSEHKQP